MEIDYHWLESKLPTMQCDNCGVCCGIVVCTVWENKRIEEYVVEHNIMPASQGVLCPYFQVIGEGMDAHKGCAIYSIRPMVCRLMGHVPDLKCKQGYGGKLKAKTGRRLMKKYVEKLGNEYEVIFGHQVNAGPAGEPIRRRMEAAIEYKTGIRGGSLMSQMRDDSGRQDMLPDITGGRISHRLHGFKSSEELKAELDNRDVL